MESLTMAGRLFPLALLWLLPSDGAPPHMSPLLALVRPRPGPLVVFRSAFGDPNAFYFAIKGGSPSLSHAHMDAGSFNLTADGVEWATDLGMQEYESLEKLQIPLWIGKAVAGPSSVSVPSRTVFLASTAPVPWSMAMRFSKRCSLRGKGLSPCST